MIVQHLVKKPHYVPLPSSLLVPCIVALRNELFHLLHITCDDWQVMSLAFLNATLKSCFSKEGIG